VRPLPAFYHFANLLPSRSSEVEQPLSIKNDEVERLVAEVAALAHESKTEAVRRALEERRARLVVRVGGHSRAERLRRLLESEIWPQVPPGELGRTWTREEEDAVLGYGPEGA